jgi:site-specific recombinase XerD
LVDINVDDFREEDVLVVRGKGRKERFVIIGEYAQGKVRVARQNEAAGAADAAAWVRSAAVVFSLR